MSIGLPSDEVSADYLSSLEDLTINSRYEISNLTVIAKENTEHAAAISRVLEKHIKTTTPDSKLPALYVLDSVVKNVGTPYTLFLGHNLYNIFMDAYASVSTAVRRKLDEMLRTWKEPVPGSNDPRPVFPSETTRPIENALIRWRTNSVNRQQQIQLKNQQEMMARRQVPTQVTAWRSTPTPPQANGMYRPPHVQSYPQPVYPSNGLQNGHYLPPNPPQLPFNHQYRPQPGPPLNQQPPYQSPPTNQEYHASAIQHDSLHRNVENLIQSARNELATSPWDGSIQIRLRALLDLQGIVSQGQLQPHDMQAVQDQVSQIFGAPRPSVPVPTPAPGSYMGPAHPQPSGPQQYQQPDMQTPVPQTTDLQALLSSNNLADIIAKAKRETSTPPTPQASLQSVGPSFNTPTSSSTNNEPALLASLRASGLLTPSNGSYALFGTPPPQRAASARLGQSNDVALLSTSLKIPRPHLISTLYEAQPNQCMTCGKRFLITDEGREKKARHLDWHFRTNQRLADSAKRGQSRSWYVDELDWIKSRDDPEGNISNPSSTNNIIPDGHAASAAVDPRKRYIPVPSDQELAKLPCPICQERFDTVWNDEAQDFVWMDAIIVGSRIYHASCHSELKTEGRNTPGRIGTPDNVLGKRKAFLDIDPPVVKVIKAA